MAPLPDYYAVLGVSPTATPSEVREAYKRQSLQCHPDRFPNVPEAEKQRLTTKFQSLADAYYVLSNAERREEYDGLRGSQGFHAFGEGEEEKEQRSTAGTFNDVFAELLRPEVQRVVPIWKWVGSASGAGLGFILANIPGAIGGAVVGNRIGAIRDAKGKSVGAVFMNLSAGDRAAVLKALAVKVLGSLG
ncbi:DnaJ-domain-containing protein [Microstroma glucosiphilum]|uniref:DnaJ-domain-containing protein n=1 Tax=Pseudomicrostroma glucosiphilum TaxID=1684307 RepID=A0A316U4N0_9BASI|nr:DnaJ-domain-containing protein [Pseudomicrostroma glucosiphilum]PWN19774.1 DnaJ-domain-containing protein [Pseudomicrostroma glucosiphilum]